MMTWHLSSNSAKLVDPKQGGCERQLFFTYSFSQLHPPKAGREFRWKWRLDQSNGVAMQPPGKKLDDWEGGWGWDDKGLWNICVVPPPGYGLAVDRGQTTRGCRAVAIFGSLTNDITHLAGTNWSLALVTAARGRAELPNIILFI